MRGKIRKYGTSVVVLVDRTELDTRELAPGDVVEIPDMIKVEKAGDEDKKNTEKDNQESV